MIQAGHHSFTKQGYSFQLQLSEDRLSSVFSCENSADIASGFGVKISYMRARAVPAALIRYRIILEEFGHIFTDSSGFEEIVDARLNRIHRELAFLPDDMFSYDGEASSELDPKSRLLAHIQSFISPISDQRPSSAPARLLSSASVFSPASPATDARPGTPRPRSTSRDASAALAITLAASMEVEWHGAPTESSSSPLPG